MRSAGENEIGTRRYRNHQHYRDNEYAFDRDFNLLARAWRHHVFVQLLAPQGLLLCTLILSALISHPLPRLSFPLHPRLCLPLSLFLSLSVLPRTGNSFGRASFNWKPLGGGDGAG